MQIRNINGEYTQADVIRYFKNDETDYLIYSLGETDEAGYVRLYASKIVDNKACIIADSDEWQTITQIIKETVRNNRDGNEIDLIDLNEKKLEDITLQDTRIFKLQGNLVTLLAENKNVLVEQEEAIEENIEEIDEIIEERLDFEQLYNEQIEKNSQLSDKINSLEEELEQYKGKLEKIKNLLEETID